MIQKFCEWTRRYRSRVTQNHCSRRLINTNISCCYLCRKYTMKPIIHRDIGAKKFFDWFFLWDMFNRLPNISFRNILGMHIIIFKKCIHLGNKLEIWNFSFVIKFKMSMYWKSAHFVRQADRNKFVLHFRNRIFVESFWITSITKTF